MTSPSDIPQHPPYSLEAEQAVLGCILEDSETVMSECEERGVTGQWFYDARHVKIWEIAAALYHRGAAIDTITVQQCLRDLKELEGIGGLAYLSSLQDSIPSATNAGHYLEILADFRKQRIVLATAAGLTEAVHNLNGASVEALVAEATKRVHELAEMDASASDTSVGALIPPVVQKIEDYHRGHLQVDGLTTGIEYLDKLFGGIGGEQNNFVVISARPGIGKTALALDIALHVALDYQWFEMERDAEGRVVLQDDKPRIKASGRGLPVAIFSLEMTAEALVKRALFQRSGADLQRFRTGFAVGDDFVRLTKAVAELQKAPLRIDATARCTVDQIKAKARRLKRQHGIRLFIIDYIQLLRSGSKRFRDDRVQELAEISGELQSLGKELQTPILVLAQMNRDYEKDPKRIPRLSDLKDCGAIEQDADIVTFLYEPKANDDADAKYEAAMQNEFGDDWARYPQRIDALVAKNRNGPTGKCQLLFTRASTHFEDWNVWLKTRGLKAPSTGERGYGKGGKPDSGDLPSNEEMGL